MGPTSVKRAFFAVLVLAACVQPRDGSPPIEVSPGAAQRMNLIPSRRAGEKEKEAAPVKPARARPMGAADALSGPNATGTDGDWLLENDEVAFVISGLGHSAGFAESGGNLVDAADARLRKDELGLFFTYFGEFPRQAVYDRIERRVGSTGIAEIEAHGVELLDASVAVTTTYTLAPGDRALLIRTTLTNTGSAEVKLAGLGDAIQWGGAEKVAPGMSVGFRGRSSGAYLGGIGRHVSYGLTSVEGTLDAISGGSWSDTEQVKPLVLAPGESTAYARVFVVGRRPDLASIVAEIAHASGESLGTVRFDLVDAAGKAVAPAPGAKLVLHTPAGAPVLSVVRGDEVGPFEAELPPGRYLASFAPSVGRRALRAEKIPVLAAVGARTKAVIPVTEASALTLGPCTEQSLPVPCKMTLEGMGVPNPELGARHLADGARNQLVLGPGEVRSIPLPRGRYRVTASRGPEYDLAVSEIEVGDTEAHPFALRRVVRTDGYVATDFHQHTVWSADAPVAVRDRLRANAAEGVEVAVASEHNVVVDLQKEVGALDLGAFLVEISGDEVTTDSNRAPWGHLNAYPLPFLADAPRGGAPAVRDRPLPEIVKELRARPGERVLQMNHPRSGKNGVFDQLAFDAKTGRSTSPEWTEDFDALEVWNGRNVDARSRVTDDWFALLRRGKAVTPIADTDTHGIVGEEPGYPRTWVRVANDTQLASWDDARTRELTTQVRKGRDVVLSNGPFVQVKAWSPGSSPVGIGGLVRAKGKRTVNVEIDATAASWVAIDSVEVRFVREPRTLELGFLGAHPGPVPMAHAAHATTSFEVKADEAFVVVVRGKTPMRPVLSGDDAEILPYAMTGPIFVDADGDGRALGR